MLIVPREEDVRAPTPHSGEQADQEPLFHRLLHRAGKGALQPSPERGQHGGAPCGVCAGSEAWSLSFFSFTLCTSLAAIKVLPKYVGSEDTREEAENKATGSVVLLPPGR